MGGEGCSAQLLRELWGCLPPLYVMMAIPVLSAFLLTPSTPAGEGVKMVSFSLGKFTLPGGFSERSVPGKIRLHGPSRLWMLGEVEEWGTVTVFFHRVI